jgi:hypothetical protein
MGKEYEKVIYKINIKMVKKKKKALSQAPEAHTYLHTWEVDRGRIMICGLRSAQQKVPETLASTNVW